MDIIRFLGFCELKTKIQIIATHTLSLKEFQRLRKANFFLPVKQPVITSLFFSQTFNNFVEYLIKQHCVSVFVVVVDCDLR